MGTEKSPFLKMEIAGTTRLINSNHIVTVNFKGTSTVDIKLITGEVIEVPHTHNLLQRIQQQHD